MEETTALAEFVAETGYGDVPDRVHEASKVAIRDYVGVAVYGGDHPVGDRIGGYVSRAFPGDDATVLDGTTASAPGAALANGTFGHAVDYDDTFESIVIHPTSPVFAAALAAGETVDADGRDLLAAYAVGCEVAYRVGHATYPSHYDNGWHSTGTVGSFGAAAAAASVLGLDADATRRAFGVVASSSSSLKKNFGTMTKPLHAGHAAQMGVRAAMLADAGYTADRSALAGDMGYGAVMTLDDGYDPATVTTGLPDPKEWAVEDVGFKPYPSGVITHAAMDAMRDLVTAHGLSPADVERVVVTLEEAANEMLIHADAEDELEAKFSIEFCLAAVLREGDAGVHEFTDEYVRAPATRAAMEKVERDFEVDLFGDDFAGYGARVAVETVDGERYEAAERHAPGSPNNPVSEERLVAKFEEAAGAVLSDDAVDDLRAAVEGLEADGALDRLRVAVRD
ncbi:MAG: MmgE/PrpD family protein [Haloferacaceae archaeon]